MEIHTGSEVSLFESSFSKLATTELGREMILLRCLPQRNAESTVGRF
jgi:hypothetical protein